jgi:predicted ATPase
VDLIGRRDEISQVVDRLARRRLVTLIGPAGIGKTALAQAVATDVAGSYELGYHVVDLTRVDTADAVAGAIAGQLGFASFEALLVSPSDQTALVVIDNCEHVTAAAADAVATLLETCSAPTVLATSRSPLDLPDESLVVLGPLGLPAPGTVDAANDAVRLFLERARDHGAPVPNDQLDAVVSLCRQLDGVPLAIELAAARARTMHPAEILARLADGIDVLSRPRFRGDPRHRSLAATLEWSYRLLPADVAALLDRIGLFAGPFTGAMAREVGVDAGLTPTATDEALRLLVDSSLVVAETGPPSTRFRLLETVKAFAVRRLEEQGLLDEARSRLADHVIEVAAAALPERIGRQWNAAALDRTLTQYDNVVAALRWCIAHDDDGTRALMLTSVLWGVVHQGHSDEIANVSRQAIERWPDPTAPFAADAVATAATAVYLMGDPAGAFDLAERTLAAADSSTTAPALLRRAMGYAATALGQRAAALEIYGEVSDHARRLGLAALAMEADVNRALLLADRDLAGAIALARDVRAEAAAAGSAINEVWARSALGHLLLREDAAAGLATVSQALDEGRRIRFPGAIGVNLRTLAWGLTSTGQYRAAAEALLELYDNLLARGQVADIRGALLTTAELLHAVGAEAWVTLAATAESLPLVGPLGSTMDALVELPPHDSTALSRRDAVALARRELRVLLAGAEELAPAAGAPTAVAPAARTPAEAALSEHGDYWAVTFAGRTIHAKTSKGMADLRRLLSSPGREVHSVELMGAGVEQSSTGEVLDQTARRQYEQRVRELQADIDAADADNDYARAERARIELDTLVDHLTAALGLGGRSRRGGGTAERARSAVTQRIRSTIRRLGAAHPELGRHLAASITTGTYCVYRPEHPVDWQL